MNRLGESVCLFLAVSDITTTRMRYQIIKIANVAGNHEVDARHKRPQGEKEDQRMNDVDFALRVRALAVPWPLLPLTTTVNESKGLM